MSHNDDHQSNLLSRSENDYHIIFKLRNLWSGNLFLKSQDLTSHKVVLVDWTHAQFAPLTVDVIHLLFTCGGNIAEDMTEALNDYYDYLKVRT